MKSRIICRRCGNALSAWLRPVAEGFVVKWVDDENIVPLGRYWLADEDLGNLQGRLVIHLDDRRGMKNHPDPRRFVGCCGASSEQVNLLCAGCEQEVATEVSDCYTSFYAHYEPAAVTLQACSEVRGAGARPGRDGCGA